MGLYTDDAHACEHLLNKQCELQYTAMFDGLIHKDWSDAQDTHLQEKSLWMPQSDGVQWTDCNEFVHGANAK
eukprot:11393444-Ditylum_brightwellii.AAC.1